MKETTFLIARNLYNDMKRYEMLEKMLEEGGNIIVISSDLTQQFEIGEDKGLINDILKIIRHHKENTKEAFKIV